MKTWMNNYSAPYLFNLDLSNIDFSNLAIYNFANLLTSLSMEIETMQANAREAASLLKIMSHPDRLMVLCQLTEGEVCVSELLKNSRLSQSAFSQHLSVLRTNRLIKARKEAQQVFYSLADPRVKTLIGTLHQLFCQPSEE